MSKTAIILGANGRFGRAASQAFSNAGWVVRTFTRNLPDDSAPSGYQRYSGDAFDASALTHAAQGCDVIINALNPPYQNWTRDLPKLTDAVIASAKATGATVIVPGNVYNFGADMPPVLTETTPHIPTTRKGKLREAMEETYANAADDGVQTIILRGGDFIEREKTGNWFDTYIASKVADGKITYPGPLDQVHAWAYLPDMARAAAELAEKRNELGPFTTFGFEGFNLTGAELVKRIEGIQGRDMKVSNMPWRMMRIAGWFVPVIREVMEMRYLWQVPHAISGQSLRETLPDFRPTPIETALRDVLCTDQVV